MSIETSPSVNISEIDKTHYIPQITNEIGAFVGFFEKGPINQPVFISNINEFKFIFGRGIDMYHNDWYQVYNFLQYSSGIWVCRASGLQHYNANNGDSITIENKDEWESMYDSIELTNNIRVIAKTPGEAGNLLEVGVINYDAWENNVHIGYGYTAKKVFKYFREDNIGTVVFRNGKIVESTYIAEVDALANSIESKYVYFKFDDIIGDYYDDSENGYSLIELSKGSVNFATDDEFETAYQIFNNKDSYDIDIIIGNEYNNQAAINIAETRKDCLAFIGIPTRFITFLKSELEHKNDVLYTEDGLVIALHDFKLSSGNGTESYNRILDYISGLTKSEYVHFIGNVKEQVDGFTGKARLVNLAGDTAGLKAQASLQAPWSPGAGLERGIIKNGESIYIKMSKPEKNRLYKMGVNLTDSNTVTTQKTFSDKKSSFNRINTRSLFNHLEKTVQKALRKHVFEENRESVRRTITLDVKNILMDIKTNRGIEAGKVTARPSVDNPNAIVVDIYVKPLYVAEYIQLRITNVGTKTMSSILSNTLG